MSWSPQQQKAIKAVQAWLKDPSAPFFYLAGFAGTGKTTLAKELARGVTGRVLFGAYTGKAALVLRNKGCDNASTIHSMIYRLDDEAKGWEPKFKLNPHSSVADASLVIIDECSMVGEDIGRDLLSFGTKVLVLGDPAQLPPVKGAGFFTSGDPDFMLTEVHRQAADNPIIAMSMTVREGKKLQPGTYGDSRVVFRDDIDAEDVLRADQILVGMNRTRQSYNGRIRQLKEFDPYQPQPGDRLVCLRNDKEKKLLNGGLWDVQSVTKSGTELFDIVATSDDHIESKPTEVSVRKEFFEGREDKLSWQDRRGTQEFTYGYALTVHKSQGSQWDEVMVFDESLAFRDDAQRHLYTAITRAAERVTIVR